MLRYTRRTFIRNFSRKLLCRWQHFPAKQRQIILYREPEKQANGRICILKAPDASFHRNKIRTTIQTSHHFPLKCFVVPIVLKTNTNRIKFTRIYWSWMGWVLSSCLTFHTMRIVVSFSVPSHLTFYSALSDSFSTVICWPDIHRCEGKSIAHADTGCTTSTTPSATILSTRTEYNKLILGAQQKRVKSDKQYEKYIT